MTLQLDKINPRFRQLVDLLFFSNRQDLDLSQFKELLKGNYNPHFNYLWDRFTRGVLVAWEDGPSFWKNRLTFLLSLNDKNLSKRISEHLEKKMFAVVRHKYDADPAYDIEYLQFLELCKVKHSRNENLTAIKSEIIELSAYVRFENLITIVNSFIPTVFPDINEYVEIVTKKIISSARNYDLLVALESKGIPFNKEPVVDLAKELILERDRKPKNCRAFFTILNDPYVRERLKEHYDEKYHDRIISIVRASDVSLIEDFHLRNIKNLILLDPEMADEIAIIYADKVYNKGLSHKRACADKFIRLLKVSPEISHKKFLVYLSSKSKMFDIKHLITAFPDLKSLAAFV